MHLPIKVIILTGSLRPGCPLSPLPHTYSRLLLLLGHVADDLNGLAFEEQALLRDMGDRNGVAWERILAWRMLYATLDSAQRAMPYGRFLQQMDAGLRDSLQPADVIIFVRRCAQIAEQQNVVMVFMLDEAHTFAAQQPTAATAYPGPATMPVEVPPTWIQCLLSAFVKLRQTHPPSTMPVCLVTSSLYSSTQLTTTDSSKARIADLQLVPLNDRQCYSICAEVCQRVPLTAPPAPPPPGTWTPISFAASSTLAGQDLPDETKQLLLLCGGNPRMLAYTLACMANTPADQRISLGKATCMCGIVQSLPCMCFVPKCLQA